MLGYACMSRTLREREPPLRCNRDMQRKTWESRGEAYAAELATQNLADLYEILRWNVEHDIHFYRCTSDLVPWNSQFDLEELPGYERISELAAACGEFVRDHGMRLTFHPAHWCKLASDSPATVDNALKAVEYHADWLDLMGPDRSPRYCINVHIGATYGDKAATADRFRDALDRLSPGARKRLTVENDDKQGLWSVPELVEAVGDRVPVVFDYHHHQFTDRGLTHREAFDLARSTWGDVRPVAHYSEPARLQGLARARRRTRNTVYIPTWLREAADVMVEAGAKERALLALRDDGV